jgi:hypothetical protein
MLLDFLRNDYVKIILVVLLFAYVFNTTMKRFRDRKYVFHFVIGPPFIRRSLFVAQTIENCSKVGRHQFYGNEACRWQVRARGSCHKCDGLWPPLTHEVFFSFEEGEIVYANGNM